MVKVLNGRYHLREKIGKGGMGAVFRAEDTETQSNVAVKALHANLASRPDQVQRFQREAEYLRQLNHPNIVKVLDTLVEDDTYYIVMEYIDGGTLIDLQLLYNNVPIQRIMEIGLDLADALTRAHRLKIIHRDLKPANVLLASDGTPRLTDFGIALIPNAERVTGTDTVVGTAEYVAPEVLSGGPVTLRADIWGFGVTLFEMVIGRNPFRRTHINQTINAVLNDPLPDIEQIRPDCPIPFADLIYRMVTRTPNNRVASIRQVGLELESLVENDTFFYPIPSISSNTSDKISRFDQGTQVIESPKHNLPAQTTPFVGRETELQSLETMLDNQQVRQITIVAPGGMGKTRLALETAQRHLTRFSGGVYLVELAPITDGAQIILAIAEAIGLRFNESDPDTHTQLLDYLSKKAMLLILDNFEHLIEHAPLVTEILQAAENVKILATSRHRLQHSSETIFILEGLDVTDWTTLDDALESSAVQVFINSAKRVRANFELQAEHLADLARICRLVHGMPLGIVLSASWLEMLSISEIADEIALSIDFLETDMTDIPERQRSLRAVFDYSWKHMPEKEQDIFVKLSIFRDSFTREAASAVTGANLRNLMNLMNKSVLRRDHENGYFTIHHQLHQFGAERLSDSHDVNKLYDKYCHYYLEFLIKREKALVDRRQLPALDDIERNWKHILHALQYALDARLTDLVNRAIAPLSIFLSARKPIQENFVVFDLIRQAYNPAPNETPSLVWAKASIRFNPAWYYDFDDHSQERDLLHQALQLAEDAGDHAEAVYCLSQLGYRAYWDNQLDDAIELLQRSIALGRDIDAQAQVVRAMARLSDCYAAKVDHDQAYSIRQDALELAHKIGDLQTEMDCLERLAGDARFRGDFSLAESYLEVALKVSRRRGDKVRIARIRLALSEYKFYRGQFEQVNADVDQISQTLEDFLQEDVIIVNAMLARIRFYLALRNEDYIEAGIVAQMSNSLNPNTIHAQAELNYAIMVIDLANNHLQSAQQHLIQLLDDSLKYEDQGTMIDCLPNLALYLHLQGKHKPADGVLHMAHGLMGDYGRWLEDVPLYTPLNTLNHHDNDDDDQPITSDLLIRIIRNILKNLRAATKA